MNELHHTLIVTNMQDRHNQPPFPIGSLKISGGVHPKEYRRDWGAYVVPVIFAAVIIATVIALVRL